MLQYVFTGCKPCQSHRGWWLHLQHAMSQDKLQGCPSWRQDTVMCLSKRPLYIFDSVACEVLPLFLLHSDLLPSPLYPKYPLPCVWPLSQEVWLWFSLHMYTLDDKDQFQFWLTQFFFCMARYHIRTGRSRWTGSSFGFHLWYRLRLMVRWFTNIVWSR